MSEEGIRNTISEIIVNHQLSRYKFDLRNHKFSDNDLLSKDLNVDSLDVMETILSTEDALSVRIPDSKIKNLYTFGDLCKLFTESGA
jgi:acyl carrier protein